MLQTGLSKTGNILIHVNTDSRTGFRRDLVQGFPSRSAVASSVCGHDL